MSTLCAILLFGVPEKNIFEMHPIPLNRRAQRGPSTRNCFSNQLHTETLGISVQPSANKSPRSQGEGTSGAYKALRSHAYLDIQASCIAVD